MARRPNRRVHGAAGSPAASSTRSREREIAGTRSRAPGRKLRGDVASAVEVDRRALHGEDLVVGECDDEVAGGVERLGRQLALGMLGLDRHAARAADGVVAGQARQNLVGTRTPVAIIENSLRHNFSKRISSLRIFSIDKNTGLCAASG